MRTGTAKQQTIRLALTLIAMLNSPMLLAETGSQPQSTMAWPMQAGESVNDLALLFYPQDKHMQQQFVAAVIKLNQEQQPDLNPAIAFDVENSIVIPSIKALSKKGKRKFTQPASGKRSEVNATIQPVISAKLEANYQNLLERNAVFKQELDALNIRLASLQQLFLALKADLIRMLETAQAKTKENAQTNAAANASTESAAAVTAQKIVNPAEKVMPAVTPAQAGKNRLNSLQNNAAQTAVASTTASAFKEQAYFKLLVPVAAILLAIGLFVGLNLHTRRQAKKIELAANKTTQTFGAKTVTKVDDDREEGELVLEQAKIYVNLGKENDAIRILEAHIQAAPKAALQHWLYLLDIYRATNKKDAFMHSAKQLHQTFNVAIPRWDKAASLGNTVPVFEATSLEEYGYIVDKVTKMWADCAKEASQIALTKEYLDQLLTDNRDGERNGFSREVVEDIMLLRDTLNAREKLAHEA